ncbi:MAG TPA: hypothetical protein VFZ70_16670 [Euzebyales bacterium]
MTGERPAVAPFDPLAVARWGWRMAEELSQLPEAIAQWRQGVALFLAVARRLEAATGSAEELLAQIEASGLTDQLAKLQALSFEVGRQTAVGGTAVGEQVLDEARRNIEAFTRLFAPPPPTDDS